MAGKLVVHSDAPIPRLPSVLLEVSFGFLDLSDLARSKQVCKLFKDVVSHSPVIRKERERQIMMEGQAALAFCDFFPSSGGVY